MKRITTLFMCIGFICNLFAQMPPQEIIPEVKNILNSKNTLDTNCDSSVALVRNPNFECGYNFYWDVNFTGVTGGTFTDATTDARSGNSGAKIDVTAADDYQRVLLKSEAFTQDLTNKTITIRCYAKASTNSQSFRMRIRANVNGSNTFSPVPPINLTTDYPTLPYEIVYDVPDNTTSIQVQMMVGKDLGIYYFDDFEFEINEDTLSTTKIDAIEASIYPNPTDGILNINSTQTVQKVEVYSLLGRLVNTYKPTSEILDLSSLPKGVYLLSVELENQNVFQKKIIITN